MRESSNPRGRVEGFALLDMDGTILSRRSLDVFCERFGKTRELVELEERVRGKPEREIAEEVARLFTGIRRRDMEEAFDEIPLNPGVKEFIRFLKLHGFKVAIATDSYRFLAQRLAGRLGIDLAFGNEVEFDGGIFTGRISSHYPCMGIPGCREYSICKLRILLELKETYGGVSLAVGDGGSDICMVQGADIGVAYRPSHPLLKEKAKIIVSSFADLQEILKELPPFSYRRSET